MGKQPAIIGGSMAFPKGILFNQPTLPRVPIMLQSIRKILQSGILTKGSVLSQYETAVKNYIGVQDAVAVSSCTTGLILLLQALKLRCKNKTINEVILPSFTFPSTAHACIWNNLTPVYLDCNPETFLLEPQSVEAAITPNTFAIMAVHVFGNPVEPEPLIALAQKYSLFLLFDAAHGFGSFLKNKPVGGSGIAEVFSTSPTKLLATAEGGIITTNDEDLGQILRISREYGNPGDYNCILPGLNGRMSELHAILGLEGLKIVTDSALKREKIFEAYKEVLSGIPGVAFQNITKEGSSSFKDIAILIKPEFELSRDILQNALLMEGIPTRTYFNPPLHKQVFSQNIGKVTAPLHNTEMIAQQVLCLPIQSHMPISHVKRVASAIKKIRRYRKEIMAHMNNISREKVLSQI